MGKQADERRRELRRAFNISPVARRIIGLLWGFLGTAALVNELAHLFSVGLGPQNLVVFFLLGAVVVFFLEWDAKRAKEAEDIYKEDSGQVATSCRTLKSQLESEFQGSLCGGALVESTGLLAQSLYEFIDAARGARGPQSAVLKFWDVMCGTLLRTFSERTGDVARTGTLPADFNTYAACVWSILKALQNDRDLAKECVVWTIFYGALSDWYNLVTGPDGIRFTQDWWEDYKDRVRLLRTQEFPFQMRRLVFQPDEAGGVPLADLYVYCPAASEMFFRPDHERGAVSIRRARGIYDRDGMTAIQRVKDTIDHRISQETDFGIYLIGYRERRADGHDPPMPSNWVPLRTHFEETYHNGCLRVSDGGQLRDASEKGVYYGYVSAGSDAMRSDLLKAERYADIFLVEVPTYEAEHKMGFGIRLVRDVTNDVKGIQVYNPIQFDQTARKLREAADACSRSPVGAGGNRV